MDLFDFVLRASGTQDLSSSKSKKMCREFLGISRDSITQLFEKGSRRNLKSNFGAFNTQWKLVSIWNPSLKYVSTFHFLTKMDEIFCGVKVDAMADGNKIFEESRSLEMPENG